MIITNDTITFETSDIAQLSPELQKALALQARKQTAEVFLSAQVNRVLTATKATAVSRKIAAIKAGAALATPAEKAQVDDLLLQAEDILKIPAPIRLTSPKPAVKLPTKL